MLSNCTDREQGELEAEGLAEKAESKLKQTGVAIRSARRLPLVRKVAVVYNARSGAPTPGSAQSVVSRLTELFTERGLTPEFRVFKPETVEYDVRALLADGLDALFVAGGDGTVTCVAEQVIGSDVPLGLLPAGTMNVLARDLGVPDDLADALDALLAAPVRLIDVARINGRLFLCSSALAMMPHLGRIRERVRGASGWPVVRLWARGLQVLRGYPRMRLRIVVDGRVHVVRTRAVVVTNNRLSSRSEPLPVRDRLDTGRLAVYVTRDRTHWDLLRIAASVLDGSWQNNKRVRMYEGRTLQVSSSRLRLTSVMSDGEVSQLPMPLQYDIQPRALPVLDPRATL